MRQTTGWVQAVLFLIDFATNEYTKNRIKIAFDTATSLLLMFTLFQKLKCILNYPFTNLVAHFLPGIAGKTEMDTRHYP